MSKLNPAQTIIVPPADVPWRVPDIAPPNSVAEATLAGGEDQDGAYLVLMKWYPGWSSAPRASPNDLFPAASSTVARIATSEAPRHSVRRHLDRAAGLERVPPPAPGRLPRHHRHCHCHS